MEFFIICQVLNKGWTKTLFAIYLRHLSVDLVVNQMMLQILINVSILNQRFQSLTKINYFTNPETKSYT